MRVSTTLIPAAVLAVSVLPACDDTEPFSPWDAPPAAAAAQAPVAFQVPFAFELQCPQGYLLTNTGTATGHLRLTPANGTPEFSELQVVLRGALTNTTTGRTVRNYAAFTVVNDLATGESSIVGSSYHVVSIGAGIVVLDAGIVRFDDQGQATFEPGRHDLESGAFEELQCELLA
jgi:hypothetical protein